MLAWAFADIWRVYDMSNVELSLQLRTWQMRERRRREAADFTVYI